MVSAKQRSKVKEDGITAVIVQNHLIKRRNEGKRTI
jgi:hypothetical protein